MNITVLLSSGEYDEWTGVSDAIVDEGALLVVSPSSAEETPGKIITMTEPVDNGPDLPPGERHSVLVLHALYAPGMWMRVEYS